MKSGLGRVEPGIDDVKSGNEVPDAGLAGGRL